MLQIKSAVMLSMMVLVLASVVLGQVRDPAKVEESKGVACEFNNLLLDTLIISARKEVERLFIIARPAKSEGDRINFSRLEHTRSVIVDFKRGLDKKQITIARGEASDKRTGQLEFWVGSSLRVVISILKNKQVCLQVHDYMPKVRRKIR